MRSPETQTSRPAMRNGILQRRVSSHAQLTGHDGCGGHREGSFHRFSADTSCPCHRGCPCFLFAWRELTFMGNHITILAKSTQRQEEIPVSRWQKPANSNPPHPKICFGPVFSFSGDAGGSAPLLLGSSSAVTHGHYAR